MEDKDEEAMHPTSDTRDVKLNDKLSNSKGIESAQSNRQNARHSPMFHMS